MTKKYVLLFCDLAASSLNFNTWGNEDSTHNPEEHYSYSYRLARLYQLKNLREDIQDLNHEFVYRIVRGVVRLKEE